MAALTAGQLVDLRDNHPHEKRTYLSVVLEIPLLQAQVNDASAMLGDMAIPYDTGTGTAGEFAVIQAGQTLLLGTSAGADDLGRGRVKGIAGNQVAGTVTVAWNYDINWVDGAFITVLHLYEMWPMFPRFVVSPENWLKDQNIDYVDQNTDQYPVAIMGCGWAGDLIGGTATIILDGRNSYAVAPGATITGYSWSIATHLAGAVPVIVAAAASNTTVVLDTAGLYWIKLVVTDSNGKTQATFRPFVAHDGSDLPYFLEAATLTQDWETGGCRLSFTVSGSATEPEIPDRVPVILWSENKYAGVSTDVSFLSANEYADREHIDFFGYIVTSGASIRSPSETGSVTFDAATVEERMGEKFEYPAPLIAHNGAINEWWKFPKNRLTVARGLHWLWRWHSTLFSVADVHLPTSDTLIRAGIEEFTQGSLYERADSFARNKGIFAHVVCDARGSIYVEKDMQMLDAAARAALTDTFSLTTSDWKGALEMPISPINSAAHAYLSGGAWDGMNFTPLLSKWGVVANQDGVAVLQADELMASGQTEINMLCGRLMALANLEIGEVRVPLAGNWSSAVGIAPGQWVRMTLLGTEPGNKRALVLTDVRTKILNVTTQFNVDFGICEVDVVLQQEATGRDGIDGDYPAGIMYGDPDPPPWPDTPWGDRSAVLFDTVNGCYFSFDLGVSWVARNTGLAGAQLQMQGGYVPPGWWQYQRSSDPEDCIFVVPTVNYILRSMDAGKSWLDITPVTDPPNAWGDAPAPTASDLTYLWVSGYDFENMVAVAEWQNGAAAWRGWLLFSYDGGDSWTWRALGWASGGSYGYSFLTDLESWYEEGLTLNPPVTITWDVATGNPLGSVKCSNIPAPAAAYGYARTDEVSGVIAAGTDIDYDWRKTDGGIDIVQIITDVNPLGVTVGGLNVYAGPGDSGWQSRGPINLAAWAGEILIGVRFVFSSGGIAHDAWIDNFSIDGLDGGEVRPMGCAIEQESLDLAIVTSGKFGRIVAEAYDLLVSPYYVYRAYDFGAGTLGQVAARTFWALPKTVNDPTLAGYGSYVYIHGRLPDVGGAVAHIALSTDMMQTFADIGDSAVWLANYVGGFVEFWGAQTLYAAVGVNLYVSVNGGAAWALASAMPHNLELGIAVGYDADETMLVAHSDAAAPKVSVQATPYTGGWTDRTDAFPNTGITRGVFWV